MALFKKDIFSERGSQKVFTNKWNSWSNPKIQLQVFFFFFLFLGATTSIYALGAGITPTSGTKLALQLSRVEVVKLYSFPLKDPQGFYIVIALC